MAGGGAALMGAFMLGPRSGRFGKDGVTSYIRPASPTSQVLGTFILWFGWYGFNPGSTGEQHQHDRGYEHVLYMWRHRVTAKRGGASRDNFGDQKCTACEVSLACDRHRRLDRN